MSVSACRAALLCLFLCLGSTAAPRPAQAPSGPARLTVILERAADYCQRLDQAILDFVCLEEVSETTFQLSPDTNVYLYDYQFVRRAGGGIKERRDLLAVNGKKSEVRNAPLYTGAFQYQNTLFGPIGLLSRYWQASFEYSLVGDDRVGGQAAVVIDAAPRAAFEEPHPYGRVWIREKDGAVLKIAWDQRSLGNYRATEEWARQHGARPMITAYSEFGFEKNGLRFPSRSSTEQAILREDRGKSISAEISVRYLKYRFFTVETQTIF